MKIPSFGRKKAASPTAPDHREAETAKPMASSVAVVQGDILETYHVREADPEDARADVIVATAGHLGRLHVKYPDLSPEETSTFAKLEDGLYYDLPSTLFEDRKMAIQQYLLETAEKAGLLGIVQRSFSKFSYYLMRNTFGFGKLDALIKDDDIEEISCVSWDTPVRIVHRRYTQYGFMETNQGFESEEELQAYVMKLAQAFGESITRAKPYFESSLLFEGVPLRAAATFGTEISLPGSSFSIRRQRARPYTLTEMMAVEPARPFPFRAPNPIAGEFKPYQESLYHKKLTGLMVAYFWILLEAVSNIIVCGETRAGKTTMLNATLSLVNPASKVVTVEDDPEINLPRSIHWERLRTREAKGFTPGSEKFEIDLFTLLKHSLRFSPNYLIVGEVRGEETQTLGSAMAAGHSCLSSIHAGSAEQCIQRLMTPPMNLTLGQIQLIDCVVTMRRVTLPDGREVRRVESVDEVVPDTLVPEGYRIVNIFRYVPETDGFKAATPESVVEASPRLREKASRYLGWSNEHLQRELERRASKLVDAVADEVFSVEEFTARVGRYRSAMYTSLRPSERPVEEALSAPHEQSQETN